MIGDDLQLIAMAVASIAPRETEIHTWFERDRAHVELRNAATGNTIVEWWDGAVREAIEDGFLDPRDYHGSALEYAEQHGLL